MLYSIIYIFISDLLYFYIFNALVIISVKHLFLTVKVILTNNRVVNKIEIFSRKKYYFAYKKIKSNF